MGPSTAIASGRMIPAFSVATDCSQPGAKSVWSPPTPVTTATRAVDDVGGVVAAEQADLDHGDVDRRLGEPTEGGCGHQLEPASGRTGSSSSTAASPLRTSARSTSEIGSPSRQMRSLMRSRWGLVNVPTVSPCDPQQRGDHRRHRALAVRARDVDHRHVVLRVTEQRDQLAPSTRATAPRPCPPAMPAVPVS